MITKDVTLTISGEQAVLSQPLVVFRYDRGITFNFKIVQTNYKFDKNPVNLIKEFEAVSARYLIRKPDGVCLSSQSNLKEELVDNIFSFTIEESLIDQIHEVGTYYLQIHLYDCDDNRITTPPVFFKVLDTI